MRSDERSNAPAEKRVLVDRRNPAHQEPRHRHSTADLIVHAQADRELTACVVGALHLRSEMSTLPVGRGRKLSQRNEHQTFNQRSA